VFCVPIAQMSPTQQPGQFAGLHPPAGVQTPAVQVLPGAHATQA
jgi:hypothetical protein